MSFSATITPLQGWDIVGEMKVRFDVEDNSFKRGYPTYEKPDGELSIDKSTKQGYVYPGMNWKIPAGDLTPVGMPSTIIFLRIYSLLIFLAGATIPLGQWQVFRWNCRKTLTVILIKTVC